MSFVKPLRGDCNEKAVLGVPDHTRSGLKILLPHPSHLSERTRQQMSTTQEPLTESTSRDPQNHVTYEYV